LPSIAPKQHFLTVDLTVKLARPGTELPIFKCLRLLETIEWELLCQMELSVIESTITFPPVEYQFAAKFCDALH
jgi:hypothetical protein